MKYNNVVVGPIQQGRELPECRLPSAVKPGWGCSWHPQTLESYYDKERDSRKIKQGVS